MTKNLAKEHNIVPLAQVPSPLLPTEQFAAAAAAAW